MLQAAAILTGQEVIKKPKAQSLKKRPRSPAKRKGSLQQGHQAQAPQVQHGPHTPGLSTQPELFTPERTARQLPPTSLIPGMLPRPAQVPGMMPRDFVPQAMYQSSTHLNDLQIPTCPSQLELMSLAEPMMGHAERAWLGSQPMSQQRPVSSRQVSAQLPTELPVQHSQSWDSRPMSPAKSPMSQQSPVSSRQVPAQLPMSQQSPVSSRQLPAQLPVPLVKSRDPRRSSYHCPAMAATLSKPMLGLRHSPQQAHNSEPVSPMSPTQSALLATILMPDSPEACSSGLNAGGALMMTPSPRWHSPDTNRMSHLSQRARRSESSLPPMDALLHDGHDEADFAVAKHGQDFNNGSDYVRWHERIQAAAQHAQPAQCDMVTFPQDEPPTAVSHGALQPQTVSLRVPSSPVSSQTFPPQTVATVPRHRQQFPTSNSTEGFPAASETSDSPLKKRWPESQPYTICRWQLLVMQ